MNSLPARLIEHLELVYPDERCAQIAERLLAAMRVAPDTPAPPPHQNQWSQADIAIITYADSVLRDGERPLHTLYQFLHEHLAETASILHILPFFPYSSDDGFAVIDYRQVNDSLGDWDDIGAIAEDFRLMADLVINHCSARSRWFENFKKRVDPGVNYFVEIDPTTDLSAVVRPRNSPLLTEVETLAGTRHVWSTFSADQVDLNFANPDVLVEFAGIIRHYLDQGVRILRLDAVAFLWKEPGTSCIHRPQTHELIKVLRLLLEHACPDALILTETNVPNHENLTYFGNANEAHAIYNFSLPPLLLHALVSGQSRHLTTWLMSQPPAQDGTVYINFLASHDGIGLRPAEELLDDGELLHLINAMQRNGGRITMRATSDGRDRPYEINIALFDAVRGTAEHSDDPWQIERFLCAHSIMLALAGIPAFYLHSLLATGNDETKLEHTGRLRAINRHNWHLDALSAQLADPHSHHSRVLAELRRRIGIRRRQPALHPNAAQYVLHLGAEIFAFWREHRDRGQRLFALHNLSATNQHLALAEVNPVDEGHWWDLLSGQRYADARDSIELAPYQCVWLSNRPDTD